MRHITTLIVLVLLVSNSFSQVRTNAKHRKAWVFQAGPAIGVMDATSFAPTVYGAILEPKLIFGQMGRKSSVSLGAPIKILGLKRKSGTYRESGEDSVVTSGISVNVPIVMDFNFYHGAFKSPNHRLGVFLGFGWDFNYIMLNTANKPGVKERVEGLNHGPYFDGGIRFKFVDGASFDIRGFGSFGVNKSNVMVAGVALLYNFGMGKPKRKGGWF
jgi:hypothetical protein